MRFDIIFWTPVISSPEMYEAFQNARLRLTPGGEFFHADVRVVFS